MVDDRKAQFLPPEILERQKGPAQIIATNAPLQEPIANKGRFYFLPLCAYFLKIFQQPICQLFLNREKNQLRDLLHQLCLRMESKSEGSFL